MAATTTSSPISSAAPATRAGSRGLPSPHQIRLGLAALVTAALLLGIAFYGFPYYILGRAARAASPLHLSLKPSGTIGLRLGLLGLAMFFGLFLYPLRKRSIRLSRIGVTRHWFDFHVLLGIAAPLAVTLHSSFKFGGLAGIAYWIMIAVATSGFIGRYLYTQIPRRMSEAELSLKEMEEALDRWKAEMESLWLWTPDEVATLLRLPSREEVERMGVLQALLIMGWLDLSRPFRISGLRRRRLTPLWRVLTLGGLLPSRQRDVEAGLGAVRRHSWLSTKLLFLRRVQQLFHLWHVIHRPFSYSFAVLVVVHVGVVMLLGYY